jgi:hypothetical protein
MHNSISSYPLAHPERWDTAREWHQVRVWNCGGREIVDVKARQTVFTRWESDIDRAEGKKGSWSSVSSFRVFEGFR